MRSGRFCPESGSPCIECTGIRHGGAACEARKPPDALLSSRLPKGREGAPYVPLTLPHSFEASSGPLLGSLVLERVGRILPETSARDALRYLKDASLVLSLSRAYQSIVVSSSRYLIPSFESVLRGPVPEKTGDHLERALRLEKESALEKTSSKTRANRVKALFHLINAAALRRQS